MSASEPPKAMTPNLIPLIGARHVRISEPEGEERFDGGLIKEMTGGEPLHCERISEDFIPLTVQFRSVRTSDRAGQ